MPCYGNYCGPGHPPHSRYDEPFVDEVDKVCMMHDRCYDSGVSRPHCDGAMANSLAKVDDPDNFYGRRYVSFADKWMHLMGEDHADTLEQVLEKRGKTMIKEPGNFGNMLKEALKIEEKLTNNKKGTGQSKRARRRANKASKDNIQVKITPTGNGFVAKSSPKKATRAAKRKRNAPRRGRNSLNPTYPPRYSQNPKNLQEHTRMTGCERLTKVQFASAGDNTLGNVLLTQDCSPYSFTNTRLKQISQLWQKYRFHRLRFHFVTADSEFYSGTLLHYVDTDALADYSSIDGTDQALQNASAHFGEQPFRVSDRSKARCTVYLKPIGNTSALWVDQDAASDKRLWSQGKYFLFIQNVISNSQGTALTYPFSLGDLYVEYDCEFYGAALNSGTGFFGSNGLKHDMYNGIQYVAWDISGGGGAAPGSIDGVSFLTLAQKTMMGKATLADGDAVLPNTGIVSTNELYMHFASGDGFTQIQIYAWGGKVRLSAWGIYTGTGLVAGTQGAWVASTNCSFDFNGPATYTSSGTSMVGQNTCDINITDPTKVATLYWNWVPVSAHSTETNFQFRITAMQRIAEILVAPPQYMGCRYRYKSEIKKRPIESLLLSWSAHDGCDDYHCPVCPSGRILRNLRGAMSQPPSYASKQTEMEHKGWTMLNKEESEYQAASSHDNWADMAEEEHSSDEEELTRCQKNLRKFCNAKTKERKEELATRTCTDINCDFCAKIRAVGNAQKLLEEKEKAQAELKDKASADLKGGLPKKK